MKKLVLLVAVFLLIAGMVAAQVTFAPVVTGTSSVTWGMDLKTAEGVGRMNSGFDAANTTSLDLGVVVDPVDAKSGDGIYGEVTMSGLAVTAKSGADVVVAAPSIDAKLWFSEAMYASIFTDMKPNYSYAGPLGNLVTVDDNKQEGTWYDSGADYSGAKVVADYGNAGYGFTYMAGDLTVNLDFVSGSKWGNTDTKEEFKLETYDLGLVDGEKENGVLSQVEMAALINAIFGTAEVDASNWEATGFTRVVGDYTYVLQGTPVAGYSETLYALPNDGGKIQLWKYKTAKLDSGSLVTMIDTGDKAYDSLYTVGIDVAYTLTDIGVFKAYVLPTHTDATKLFTKINLGAQAAIALASFDMVGLTVGADVKLNNEEGTAEADKMDYEVAVSVPVKVGDMLTMNFKAAFTDADTNTPLDLYADATVMAAGATVKGAYQVSNFMEAQVQSASYTLSASYPVAVGEGTVTPMVAWAHDMATPNAPMNDNEGYLTVSAAAAVVENTTFTLKYASGDMLTQGEGDMGVVTFETKFAY